MDHTSTLRTVNNLGVLYKSQGKLAEAEEMYSRALKGKEKALGADHTSTLDTVNNLGLLYKSQGKLAEAEEMYLRALQGYKKALGVDHTSTLGTVNNLGILYQSQGKLLGAEEMYLRALKGYEQTLGVEHTSTLDTIQYLCSLYCRMAFDARFKSHVHVPHYMRNIGKVRDKSPQKILSDCAHICQQYSTSSSLIFGYLGHILMWLKTDDSAVIAFEQQIELTDGESEYHNVVCDACGETLSLRTGRLICKNCLDGDLCHACYEKYESDEIKVRDCQDHRFLACPRDIWASLQHGTVSLTGETLEEWLASLKLAV